MKMNEKQQLAIESNEQSVFLLSGAGTGKTSVITNKVNWIMTKISPNSKILILSFTKRSVFDLKKRFSKTNDNLFITTFHGLCYHMISADFDIHLFDAKFRSSLELSDAELLQISASKRLLDFRRTITKPFYEYSSFLTKNQLIDYTDLEILTLEKLKKSGKNLPEDATFDYIFIDEFQDTSMVQFELLKMLCQPKTIIFAVGDPDQSIYSFRGTGLNIIDAYVKTFHASVLNLDQNYRCSVKILYHANLLIKHNRSKLRTNLKGIKKSEGTVQCHLIRKVEEEVSLVILNIRSLLKSGFQQKEIAIIFRNHKDVVRLRYALTDHYMTDIHLLSMHQSKGLEFKVVLIIGVKPVVYENKSILYEERRLFFVSMTRAMDHLYVYGYLNNKGMSRFLKECKFKYETHD